MMLEQHHDDETLIAMLEANDTNDAHLRSCEDCTETLAALRDISSALHHEDVWERREISEAPVGASIAMLRAAADRLQGEAAQAEVLVEELLRIEPAIAEKRVRSDVRYQTAGVARKLVELVETEKDINPRRALDIANLAVAVAENLSTETYPSETRSVLRGSAYRQLGVCFNYSAQYSEALRVLELADRELDSFVGGTYEKGRVAINRVAVNVVLEQTDAAMADARESQRAFSEFQEPSRLAAARFAEAYVLFKLNHTRKALAIFEKIKADDMNVLTDDVQARVHMNIGFCQLQLDQVDQAAKSYYLAARLFEQAGTRSEATRMRWHLAHLARSQGKIEEAVRRFDEIAIEFAELGMVIEVALAHLDTAETLATVGDYRRVEELSRSALRQYEISGLGYGSRAMTALAYLSEAAKHRRATPEIVKHVKDYLRRLPQEPALLFAPIPEPPQNLG